MIKVSISELKTNLSDYLRKVEEDEVVEICRHNQPIAEIHRLRDKQSRKAGERELGAGSRILGQRSIPDETFAPLPVEVLSGLGPQGTYQEEQ